MIYFNSNSLALACLLGSDLLFGGISLVAQSDTPGLQKPATNLGSQVEFSDGKTLPLGNESNFLRVRELVDDKNWLSAAKQVVSIIDELDDKLFFLREDNGSRVFVDGATRSQALICDWGRTAPDALVAYQSLVNAEAETLYQKSLREQNLTSLRLVAKKYFASNIGDQATNQLATIEFEAGNFLVAASLWDSLIDNASLFDQSLYVHPDSDLAELDVMTNSLAASLLSLDFDLADTKLKFLEQKFPASRFKFLGKSNLELEDLKREYGLEKDNLDDLLSAPLHTQWIDVAGRPAWRHPVTPLSKVDSPFNGLEPAIAEPDGQPLPTYPGFSQDAFYWCDEHHIYRHAKIEVPQSKANSVPNQPVKVWSTLFMRDTLPTSRKRIGKPVFDLQLDSGLLFARMGDSRTSYRNDSITRNRSYLIGLDLNRGGEILPGFPLGNEDPRVEFDATPIHHDGYLFVSRRKTFRDNATSRVTIQCLELSPSNRAKELRVVWEKQWVAAETNNRGIWDEVSRTQMKIVDNNLVYCGLGVLMSLDLQTGSLNWLADYHRDRYEYAAVHRGEKRHSGQTVRVKDQLLYRDGRLFLAPSDTEKVMCFSASNGACVWQARFPDLVHLLEVADGQLIASGHHLCWIDVETGRLKARFPSTVPDSQVGLGVERNRGIGRGTVQDGFIYWPTLNQVFVLGTNLNQANTPQLQRIIDLRTRSTTGGNLHIQNGIMLIANEREIAAYME